MNPPSSERISSVSRVLVGEVPNYWLYSPTPPSYDLTRPAPPHFPKPSPNSTINLATSKEHIIISPNQTALVVVDMQNFFLSAALGAAPHSPGNAAKDVLLKSAIPATRRAGMRIMWMNWGLTDEDVKTAPPSVVKGFDFDREPRRIVGGNEDHLRRSSDEHPRVLIDDKEITRIPKADRYVVSMIVDEAVRRRTEGIGFDLGSVKLDDGQTVDAGRMLMRGTWNAALCPELDRIFQESKSMGDMSDILIHKNRMSGFWAPDGEAVVALKKAGITTLLFAGIKTDVCVMDSLLDAWHVGFDVILLKDACGTTSPSYASKAVEFNCARLWGFVTDSNSLQKGVDDMFAAA